MSEITETPEAPPSEPEATCVSDRVRLREPLQAEDHQTAMEDLHVGDFVLVETGRARRGEVRRAKRPAAGIQARPALSQGAATATDAETRSGTIAAIASSSTPRLPPARAGPRAPAQRSWTSRSTRVIAGHRPLQRRGAGGLPRPVRDLAHEFHARIEMRQIGARDTTKLMDGNRTVRPQLCCSSYLKISIRSPSRWPRPGHAAHGQPALGNAAGSNAVCSTSSPPTISCASTCPSRSACQADCGAQGCMTGKVRSLRVPQADGGGGFQDGRKRKYRWRP